MSTLTRRRLLQSGLPRPRRSVFGPLFWRQALAAEPPAQPDRPVRPAAGRRRQRDHAPAGLHVARDRAVRSGRARHGLRVPDRARRRRRRSRRRTAAGSWPSTPRSRRMLGGASAIRFDAAGSDHRRLPHPRAAPARQLRGRSDPVGHVALVRGDRRRPRLGVRPDRREPAVARPPMGVFQHEAACVDPSRPAASTSARTSTAAACTASPRRLSGPAPPGVLEVACDGGGGGS